MLDSSCVRSSSSTGNKVSCFLLFLVDFAYQFEDVHHLSLTNERIQYFVCELTLKWKSERPFSCIFIYNYSPHCISQVIVLAWSSSKPAILVHVTNRLKPCHRLLDNFSSTFLHVKYFLSNFNSTYFIINLFWSLPCC